MNNDYDIVLVSCPTSMNKRYGKGIKELGNTMPNLGLAILAAVLEKAGIKVRLLEIAANDYGTADVIDIVRKGKAKIVGITITTPNYPDVQQLAAAINKELPDVKTIVGGPHVKAVGKEVLEQAPDIHCAAYGESEEIIVPLVHALLNNGDLSGINNLIYRNGDDIVITDMAPPIADLDTIPFPAWHLLEHFPERYRLTTHLHFRNPCATLITSRGCPFNCIFCDKSMFGNKVRLHSSDYVFSMIEKLHVEYGVKHIMLYDDTFTFDADRLFSLCDKIIKSKYDITWACMSTINVTREMLFAMKKAGCVSVAYGIESGSKRILKILNKPIDLNKAREVLRWSKEAGLRTRGFFIIGSPGETQEDIEASLNFGLTSAMDDFWMAYFTPFPGSKCFTDIHEWGEYEFSYEKLTLYDPVFVPTGLTLEQMIKFRGYAHRRFYFRPKIFLSYAGFFLRNPRYFFNILKVSGGLLNVFRGDTWEDRLATPADSE